MGQVVYSSNGVSVTTFNSVIIEFSQGQVNNWPLSNKQLCHILS